MIESYNLTDISWKTCWEYANIYASAFRRDPGVRVISPSHLQYATEDLPDITEWDQLIARAKAYRCHVWTLALRTWWELRDPRDNYRLFLYRTYKGDNAGEAIGAAVWQLPSYIPNAHVGVFYRLRLWFWRQLFRLWVWLVWGNGHNPISSPLAIRLYDESRGLFNATTTEERVAELQAMPREELHAADLAYPSTASSNYTYSLKLLAIIPKAQRSGIGRKLLKQSLASLGPHVKPPDLDGPPKASLRSSIPAYQFYPKMGFICVGKADSETCPGFIHSYYTKNLI